MDFDFKVYRDQPSIIYQMRSKDASPGIFVDEFGELLESWLRRRYPKFVFIYEEEAGTLFLDPGHNLPDEQIHRIQKEAAGYVAGLRAGVLYERRRKLKPPKP